MNILERLEKNFKAFESRWPQMQAPLQWMDIVKRRGKIEFFSGDIEAAITHLKQAGDQSGDIESLLTLGTIYIFREQYDRAIALFEKAMQIHQPSRIETKRIKILALTKMGDAVRLAGKKKDAVNFYRQALENIKGLLPYISIDHVAGLHALEGQMKHRLGDREEALESFKVALSLSHSESFYGSILSYLMGTRDIGSMKEIYHLAYTDSAISKKWKLYYSLWYLALQKLMGRNDDPTPTQMISTSKGQEWVEKLAAYYGGTISYEELARSTRDKSEQVEMKFYRAFELASLGKNDQFIRLLQETVDSQYYAYYEVSIALEILFDMGRIK